jgi:hypothetical protein
MRYILMYFGSVAQSLSSGVSPVAIGHPNQRAPLRRPVKTTRILIAVGGAWYRLLPEPTPSPRLWATAPGATPARLCEHTMRVFSRPAKPELSTLVGTGTFYFAATPKICHQVQTRQL